MKIIQISDLHLPKGKGHLVDNVDTFSRLEHLIKHLRRQQLDLLVVTGDISCHEESLESYQLAVKILNQLPCPWFVMPGNHDRGTFFHDIFEGHVPAPLSLRSTKAQMDCIYLDTAIETPKQNMLNELEAMLRNLARPACLFTHYPPILVGHPGYDGKHRLGWQDLLIEILKKTSAPLHIFFGHIHYEFHKKMGPLHFYSTPSATVPTIPGDGFDTPDPNKCYYRNILIRTSGIETAVEHISYS